MGYNLEIRPKAVLDAQHATDYYDAINIDLGDRFEGELRETFGKITANPQFYKYISGRKEKKFRCIRLKSFPYIVIYSVRGKTIIVISVFSTYRKPIHGQP